jgi:ubiquinone/menaquinone biosynthesis C-methylase UbiE
MTDPHTGRAYYDDFSGWYERERHRGYHQMIDALEIDLALPYCAGKDVFEAGCGTGLILKELARAARSATGLDLSPGMAKQARSRGLKVALGSITALPFRDESFDVAASFKVLAHLKDIRLALSELARVVRPGGVLILEFYNAQSLRYLAKRLAGPGKVAAHRHEGEIFTRWDTAETIRAHLPDSLTPESWHGVRVATPAAFVHKLPGVGTLFGRAERLLRDSPLARFGGFLIVVARKR